MLDKSQLLAEVIKSKHAELRLISNATELQSRDAALFITKGTALLRDHSVFDSNIHSTQTFSAGDSIYLAATLSKRPLDRTYTIHEPLEVVSVDGTHLGHNLPDSKGNRYCINLVSVAGSPVTE